jgi:hypothetical protein
MLRGLSRDALVLHGPDPGQCRRGRRHCVRDARDTDVRKAGEYLSVPASHVAVPISLIRQTSMSPHLPARTVAGAKVGRSAGSGFR